MHIRCSFVVMIVLSANSSFHLELFHCMYRVAMYLFSLSFGPSIISLLWWLHAASFSRSLLGFVC